MTMHGVFDSFGGDREQEEGEQAGGRRATAIDNVMLEFAFCSCVACLLRVAGTEK